MNPLDHLNHTELLRYNAQAKSPGMCVLAELGGLLFGLSGVGIIFAGRKGLGLASMLGYWGVLLFVFLMGFGGPVGIPIALGAWAIWCVLTVVSAAQVARQHNRELAARLMKAQSAAPGGDAAPTVLDQSANSALPARTVFIALAVIVVVGIGVAGIASLWLLVG